LNDYVIGIFSRGALDCESGGKNVHTAIYRYIDWINEKLKLANNAQPWA
jgi:hypothetical protein